MPEMQQHSRNGAPLFPSITTTATTTTNNNSNAAQAPREPTEDDLDTDSTGGAGPHLPTVIPPWVHINTSDNNSNTNDRSQLLIPRPSEILPNTRHYRPPPPNYRPGRKWDHLRTAEPAFLNSPIEEAQTRWRPFMQAGPNPRAVYDDDDDHQGHRGYDYGRVADGAWIEANLPTRGLAWRPEDEVEAGAPTHLQRGLMYKGMWFLSPERQERTVKWFWRVLLKNPFVPLGFRLTVLAFSAAALALSASIKVSVSQVNHDSDPNNQCSSRASTYMGIIVDTIALPYIGYVTWDEYMSKPLGLRSVAAKIALLLCDIYFIVFSASNVSLAFDALADHRWACYDEKYIIVGRSGTPSATCPNNPTICYKQKALSAVLLVSLVAWLLTFSTSVLRVVEKLRPD